MSMFFEVFNLLPIIPIYVIIYYSLVVLYYVIANKFAMVCMSKSNIRCLDTKKA